MTPREITSLLQDQFGDKIKRALPDDKHPRIEIDVAHWRELAEFVLLEPLQLDWLANHSAIDYVADDQFAVVHDLYSFELKHSFAIKIFAPRENCHFPSVADLWPAADWHEREAYDLFGIVFDNHPDLRRILLSDDWEGHPLKKDYVFPRSYHGIPGSVELDWQQKPEYP